MSVDPERHADPPIASVAELTAYFRSAERPRPQHRVGLEHEKLLYQVGAPRPVPYEGKDGIGALFEVLTENGYAPIRDAPDAPPVALARQDATISLEPGGQLELSGRPAQTAREAHQENLAHIAQMKALSAPLGMRMVALGYRPFVSLEQMPWMPKARYQAMRQTLLRRGAKAIDMMLMTATGQVSFDWEDEADCAQKVTTAARLGPLLVALYANSPLVGGEVTGYLSCRSRVWNEVDPARCGYLPSMIDGTFSYQKYVDWALDAPLLFLRRNGHYATPELTFRQLMKSGFEGKPASFGDWVDHLSTLFPEVRIKRVLEVRGADCNSAALTGALAALWRGIFYDPEALTQATRLLPQLSFDEHLAFHATAQKEGLRGKLGKRPLKELAAEMVAIAQEGLRRLDSADLPVLEPLVQVAKSGRSPAEDVLEQWKNSRNPDALLDRFRL